MIEENDKLAHDQALIVFCKNPLLGRAKTRIAKDAGALEAHNIYLRLLDICIANLKAIPFPIYVFYDLYIHGSDKWNALQPIKRIQSSGDLGVRMETAFSEVFKRHKHVAIIGTDCPTLSGDIIKEAFNALLSKDLVLGPSVDGGYYLLAMNKLYTSLFEDIPWSTDTVLDNTIKAAEKLNLNVGLLKQLNDIDQWSDWKSYIAENT